MHIAQARDRVREKEAERVERMLRKEVLAGRRLEERRAREASQAKDRKEAAMLEKRRRMEAPFGRCPQPQCEAPLKPVPPPAAPEIKPRTEEQIVGIMLTSGSTGPPKPISISRTMMKSQCKIYYLNVQNICENPIDLLVARQFGTPIGVVTP